MRVDFETYFSFVRGMAPFIRDELRRIPSCFVRSPDGHDLGRVLSGEAVFDLLDLSSCSGERFGFFAVQKENSGFFLTMTGLYTRLDGNNERSGVGRALLRAAFRYAAQKGLAGVRTISPFAEGSLGFWRKVGFLPAEGDRVSFENRGVSVNLKEPNDLLHRIAERLHFPTWPLEGAKI